MLCDLILQKLVDFSNIENDFIFQVKSVCPSPKKLLFLPTLMVSYITSLLKEML